MTAQEMWQAYASREGIQADCDAWCFGEDADKLAELVSVGIKTATASLKLWYDLEKEPLPKPGSHSVILDSRGNAVCIIRTERVTVTPFREVDSLHAWKEGEGDRSLSYWRQVHESFFKRELEAAHLAFHEGLNVVCEEFVRVCP